MPERYRILIVDDDALDRQAVVRALRREAAEFDGVEADVLEVDTVARAREALQAEEFACVFLDHNLPDGTSLDLLMEVRAQGLATPVVVLTGQRDEEVVVEVMKAGAVDYLAKERLQPELVARSLRAALRFFQAQREKQAILDDLRARDRAIAAASNGIVIADPRLPDCPLVYANEAFLRMTGYSASEVLGRNCRFLQGKDTDPEAIQELREAIRQERPCQTLLLNHRKDGTTFWNEVTVSPVRDTRGVLTHFVGIQTDTTARYEADGERTRLLELATRQAAQLGAVIEAMPAGVYLGTETGVALANKVGLDMLGVDSAEALQGDIPQIAEKTALRWADTGERVSPPEQVFSRALRGERAEQTVLHRNLRTGEDLVVRSAAAPIVEDGRVVGAVVINTDMTAQKQIEESLRQFQFLSDNANDALFLLDAQGHLLYVNAAACRSLGYSAEELQQMRASDIDPIHDAATYQALFQRADGERLPPFESLHRRADGTTFPIEASVSRVDIGGRPLLFSSCRDISARKTVEEALRVANQRTATILESITDAFFALDTGWRFTYLNDQAERLLQRSREELLGRNVWDEFPAAVGSTFESNYRRAFEEQTVVTFEEYYPPPLDTWLEVRAYPSPGSLSIFFQDVSARKRSDAERERLLAEQKARAEREALLNRIGQALRESPDPEAVQGAAVQLLGEALGADRCYFALYDLAAGNVRITHERNRPELPSIQGTYPFTNTAEMFRELYRGSNTSVIPDRLTAALSTQTLANMEALQIRSRVSVALADTGGLMATLTASMSEGPRDWTTEDAALVEAVATQLRSGVETIRARQREHRIATDLQDALQPPVPEQIPGLSVVSYTQPALQEASVGGDFYDVFPLDKELYAIVMGDVSGKGLAAAQQLALIRNSLRTTLYLYRAPAQAVSNLNAIVTAHDLLAGFVTAWVGVYEVSTGQITYASCGHEPALVRRAATGSVEELGTTGLPLGVSENAEYGENTITLTKDDMLLLYTDGISESGPSRSELLGTEGLARFFARETGSGDVRADAAHLVAAVSERSLGVFRDDVAVLLSRRL